MRDVVFRLLCSSCSGSSAVAGDGAGDIEISGAIPRVARVKTRTNLQRSPLHQLGQANQLSDDSKFTPRTASTPRASLTHDSSCGTENDQKKEESESASVVKRKRGVGLLVTDGHGSESRRWERLEHYAESSPWCGPGGLLTSWRVRWILVLQFLITVRTRGGFRLSYGTSVASPILYVHTLPPVHGAAYSCRHGCRRHCTCYLGAHFLLDL